MAGNAWVRVHDHKVREYIKPGGDVNKMVHDVALETRRNARRYFIKNRTHRLAAGIQVNRPKQLGAWTIASTVFTRTKYALWVHEGTANNGYGYIVPKGSKYLVVPRNHETSTKSGSTLRAAWRDGSRETRGDKPYFLAKRVHGQRANPYLANGLSMAMAKLR